MDDPSNDRSVRAAQAGYHAYGNYVGWKNVAGLPMPDWDVLPAKIREAWTVAVRAAHDDLQLKE